MSNSRTPSSLPSHDALRVLVLLFISIVSSAEWCLGMEPSPPPAPAAPALQLPVEKLTSVSESFTREWEAAANSIPSEIWQLVASAGWKVNLVEYVVEAAPSLRGTPPRGWPEGWMWDHTDAVHLPHAKQLVIAEKRRNKRGQIVPCTRVGGVLRHELGHAFDLISGEQQTFQSSRPEFLAAYQADIAQMKAEYRNQLTYYLQQDGAGQQETFAEAFGVVFGGGSDTAHQTAFQESFPQTIEYVRRTVANVGESRLADSDGAAADEPTREKWNRIRRRLR